MKTLLIPDSERYADLNSHELRESFLLENLFAFGKLELVYCDAERTVVGGCVPRGDSIALPPDPTLRSNYFLERRELGVLNIGGKGSIHIDGATFDLARLDGMYIGRGSREVKFASASAADPAKFYLLSYPAHASLPAVQIKRSEVQAVNLGGESGSNKRTIYKYIHAEGAKSCQLVMGMTELAMGSIWNTMPPHTHLRRSEVYLYFDLAPDARVFHFMGKPSETRHILVATEQAVFSPHWSIHAGAGTARYAFCWGMGGENIDYADMEPAPLDQLR
jgi:4-deoxy-L-threo-5-hexosulose-uronate ketol-isomerase